MAKENKSELTFEEQLAEIDKKIEKTNEKISKMTKDLSKAKKDIVNLKNQRKAIMYDKDHPEEK